jgi:hypothetical protein
MLNVDHPKPTQEHKISPDQTSAPGRSGIHRPEQWAGSPLPATTSQTAGPGRTADSRSEPRCRPPEGRPRCPVRSPRCRCSLVFVLAVAAVRAGLGKELPAADEGAAEDRGSARKPDTYPPPPWHAGPGARFLSNAPRGAPRRRTPAVPVFTPACQALPALRSQRNRLPGLPSTHSPGHREWMTTKASTSPRTPRKSSGCRYQEPRACRNSSTAWDHPFAGFRSFILPPPELSRATRIRGLRGNLKFRSTGLVTGCAHAAASLPTRPQPRLR